MIHKIEIEIRVFFQNIKNFIRWIPRIWGILDWSYVSLYEIMKYQLVDLSKCIDDDPYQSVEEGRGIKRAIEILDILIGQKYHDEAFEEIYKTYPDFDITIYANLVEKTDEKGKRLWLYENKMPEDMKALWLKCLKRVDILEKKYRGELFGILRDNINYWET